MAKVIYTPSEEDGCPPTIVAFGFNFNAHKATEVPEGMALYKFRNHRHFEVIEDGSAPSRKKGKAEPEVADEEATEGQQAAE